MPDTQQPQAGEFKIPISRAYDRGIVPISGCFGAVNNQGMMVLHFYLEYPEMPVSSTIKTNAAGIVIDDKLDNLLPLKPVREVVITMAIPLIVAMPLAKLIQDQVKAFMESQGAPEPKK
jgi:hypothetical protein